MIRSIDCKQAIVQYVQQHYAELSAQFNPPVPILEALKASNWKRRDKLTAQGTTERMFDCLPYDDQLRAYTIDNSSTIISVLVVAE